MTITEFLLARIAEDEKLANYFDPYGAAVGPRRVRAECKAKRAVMEIHKIQQVPEDSPLRSEDEWTCPFCDEDRWPQGVCRTIRAIASVYADHRDYNTDWALRDWSE